MSVKLLLLFFLFTQSAFSQGTCSELYEQIKSSDCGKQVFAWLDGASVEVGLTLNTSFMDVDLDEVNIATMQSSSTLLPVFTLNFPVHYLGESSFAWSTSIGYNTLFGNLQKISRNDSEKLSNLNTYFWVNDFSFTPHIHYVFGKDQKKNSDQFTFSTGLGLGVGLSKIQGTTLGTERKDDTSCYEAGTQYLNDELIKNGLITSCKTYTFDDFAFGSSAGIFLQMKWKYINIALGAQSMTIKNTTYFLTSTLISLQATYLISI